ncbi:Hypothetical protein PHPALM_120 [Phytophthora palmivora]|uniref:Uncharacterized protein n=1 Tax=Phytophthora palmivora TaxID=4796 RepID=A0A2P4YVM4_9STRA|nr:Hypothetical protein PHPALM_120 [Phytophthora palmivora]
MERSYDPSTHPLRLLAFTIYERLRLHLRTYPKGSVKSRLGEETKVQRQHVPTALVQQTRRTDLHFPGHVFTGYHASGLKLSYRCGPYRRTKRKAKLHWDFMGSEYTRYGELTVRVYSFPFISLHTCKKTVKMIARGLDITVGLKEATVAMAITQMTLTAGRIWKHIRSEIYPEELALAQFDLTREQIIQRVHRTRRNHVGADLHGIVEFPPLSLVPGTSQPCFLFYRHLSD